MPEFLINLSIFFFGIVPWLVGVITLLERANKDADITKGG